MSTQKERDAAEAREALAKLVQPGDTVFTILRSVSASGMSRHVSVVVLKHDEAYGIVDLHPNYNVARLLGRRLNKSGDAIVCQGGGMDMGFDLVYSLSLSLFGDGYALKQRWL